jgi:hypothetical protein
MELLPILWKGDKIVSIDKDMLKKCYEETYKLIENQSNILDNVMKIHRENNKFSSRNMIRDSMKTVASLRELLSFKSKVFEEYDKEFEAAKIGDLITVSVEKSITAVEYLMAYIYRRGNLTDSIRAAETSKRLSKMSEHDLLIGLIEKIGESLDDLENVIITLDKMCKEQ